ncbi:MAG: diphosphomevalonate decarboxylase, partial [Olpidium bornovanus]
MAVELPPAQAHADEGSGLRHEELRAAAAPAEKAGGSGAANPRVRRVATCTAPYWGKRDEELLLPTNSSLSVTLSQDQLCTRTTAAASPEFKGRRLWLNGKEQPVDGDRRLTACLEELVRCRRRLEESRQREARGRKPEAPEAAAGGGGGGAAAGAPDGACRLSEFGLRICSENNFPTAAGLASSASGFACLVYAVARLYELTPGVLSLTDLSRIARRGSGSACRSLFGGFVAWRMGTRADGEDSEAAQVADERHWPELEVLVLVASSRKKHTSSTLAMRKAVETSWLLRHRAEEVVPRRMAEMERAVLAKDFPTFARLTMLDSDNFHAVCADTQPRICYLSDASEAVMQVIRHLNDQGGDGPVAAYTFDAGPNPVIYAPRDNIPRVLDAIFRHFPKADNAADHDFFANPYNVQRPRLSSPEAPPPGDLP